MKRCTNPKCREVIYDASAPMFCYSCRYMGRQGALIGGVLVGFIVALIKLIS